MYRILFICSLAIWFVAMAALFHRDVWPAWTAQDAPVISTAEFARVANGGQQFTITRADGTPLGTAWTHIETGSSNSTVHGTVVLRNLLFFTNELRIETATEFDPYGELDSFTLDVFGVPQTRINVHGERRGIYFPCEMQFGPLRRQANLEFSASHLIGESFRPFTFLPGLQVGQTWRMQVLNPLAAVTTGRTEFQSIVARVVAAEEIEYPPKSGTKVECFRVETAPQQVTAWITHEGRIVVQEVDLPGFGRIRVTEEPVVTGQPGRHEHGRRWWRFRGPQHTRPGGPGGAGVSDTSPAGDDGE